MVICAKCFVDFECEENGILLLRDKYSVQRGDLYKCPGCNAEILTGFGGHVDYRLAEEYWNGTAGLYRRRYNLKTKEEIAAEPYEDKRPIEQPSE